MKYYFNILTTDGNLQRIYAKEETQSPRELFDSAYYLCRQKHVDAVQVRGFSPSTNESVCFRSFLKKEGGQITEKA